MLLLTSTSDLVQVVTGQAVTTDVHASWVDNASGTIPPGRTNTAITGATTTTVVASPAASMQRNVQTLIIINKDASADNITIRHSDGTTIVELFDYNLGPDETLQYVDGDGFKVFDNAGNIKYAGIGATG